MQHAVTAKKGKKRASYIRSIISNKLNARSVVNFQYVTLTFFAVLTRAFTSLAALIIYCTCEMRMRALTLSILNNILAVVRSLCF